MDVFPIGKLPSDILASLLEKHATSDPRVILGPGIGLDCAVIEFEDQTLVVKSDPITFTADQIGWYAVHVNANDVATTGARPRWFFATLLLPESRSDKTLVADIFQQIDEACQTLGASLVGGHTEITAGIPRPILAGTMLGEIQRSQLITPQGARPGDRLLLTKGIPIEATSILARDFASHLEDLDVEILNRARNFLHHPGISIVPEALAAAEVGGVTAMHDPTEGGLASGVWELVEAASVGILLDFEAILIPKESREVCEAMQINPIEAIASGALLLTVTPEAIQTVRQKIESIGVMVSEIGQVTEDIGVAMRKAGEIVPLHRPARDAIASLFEEDDHRSRPRHSSTRN
ncbi:MAG: AIR synthase [Anaerolineales bacterium]|nr:AIR synthase [Anaerolineales bacterium]